MTKKTAFYLGIFFVAAGLITNTWTVRLLLMPKEYVASPKFTVAVVIFQIISVFLGLFLLIKKPAPSSKNIFLFISSIIFIFVLCEIGAKIWLHFIAPPDQYFKYELYKDLKPEDFRYTPHHYLNYQLSPDYKKGLTYHNSLGYRNREFSLEKPKGIYRIVVLGGSTAYTIKVEENEKTFTYQLEKTLRDVYNHENIEVINAGVAGYNSWESLIRLEFQVLDLDPDLVIVYHGTNDVHTRLVVPEAYKADNSGRRKQWDPPSIPFFEYSCLLRIISRRLRITNQVGLGSFVNGPDYIGEESTLTHIQALYDPRELLRKNLPVYFQRNLINMIAIAKAHGIEILLSTWAYSSGFNDYAATEHYQIGFNENNAVVREVAENHGAYLFDFVRAMSQEKKYWADGRHVNEEGALLKARLFAEFIHSSDLIK